MTSSFEHDSQRLAETYERVSDLQLESGKRLCERLGVTTGTRVLDVGCGTGRLAHWLAERVGPTGLIAGVDPLPQRIAIARGKHSTARFEVGRAEDLRAFADASFDVVCLSSVLHWVDDPAKALAEARRVVRPGGLVGITTSPHELSPMTTLSLVLAPLLAERHLDPSILTLVKQRRTTTELVRLVADAGLELVELNVKQSTRRWATAAAALDFIDASSFGTFLAPVPEARRVELRAQLLQALEQRRAADGIALRGWGLMLVATPPLPGA